MFPKIKLPSLSVRPLIKRGPPTSLQAKRNPEAKTPLNLETQSRSRQEQEIAMEAFNDNERRASDPTGNPTWIMRAPQRGRDRTFQ